MRNQRQRYVDALEQQNLGRPDDTTLAYLRDIIDEGTLGASNHVRLIQELFAHLATGTPADAAWARIQIAADLIRTTRGADTPVIRNAITWSLAGLAEHEPAGRLTELERRAAAWEQQATARRQRIVDAGAQRFASARRLLAFDYSSTVADVVLGIKDRNPNLIAVVPESRAIDGGWPYVEAFTAAELRVEYLPDMAIEHALASCDGVLLGVESLRADGSFLNTIGSRLVAQLARARGVPVFGCTDLFKLDLTTYGGAWPEISTKSFEERLLHNRGVKRPDLLRTTWPELELIPPHAYDGLITDLGLLPPGAVWLAGREAFPDEARGSEEAHA